MMLIEFADIERSKMRTGSVMFLLLFMLDRCIVCDLVNPRIPAVVAFFNHRVN